MNTHSMDDMPNTPADSGASSNAPMIRPLSFSQALSERYLSYALSTIMARSLPDVRDGLKPVHRRLLYAMQQLKLDPKSGHKKCARVVGDVIGKYHPHGDVAVYDALVRLARSFSVRYPLVDGQGNFGNVDGDNAAAMRYTEARMTRIATLMLEGIDEDAVDFMETYDGEEKEPILLPATFPNLLANGATGIAVGMATSIPPHNISELCKALTHLIKHPNTTFDKLTDLIPGPDFPTGGVLVEPRENIVQAWQTGRGSFRLRARWQTEDQERGLYQIVVTEIPFQVQKSRLIERIAELMEARKLPMLADIQDESAEDIRIVIKPANRTIEAALLMEQLFQLTELETRISLNLNVLDKNRTPRVLSMREALRAFLDHRHDVLVRRLNFRVHKIQSRLEILDGFLIAYLNLDEVIRIIREEDNAKGALMAAFSLTENQAEAILNMRLRQLRRLEEETIRKEHQELGKVLADCQTLLGNENARWKRIADDINSMRKELEKTPDLSARRTDISTPPENVVLPPEAMIEREPITIVLSDKGWIRAMKGIKLDASKFHYKDGDRARFVLEAQTTDKLMIFATNGRFYTIGCDKLPGGRGHGEPLRLHVDMDNTTDVVDIFIYGGGDNSEDNKQGRRLLVASDNGRGFIVKEQDILAQTKNGKGVLSVSGADEARTCCFVRADADAVAVIGKNRKLLIFPIDEVPEMARGKGVILQRYLSGGRKGGLSDVTTVNTRTGLEWRSGTGTGARMRTEPQISAWMGKRAQAGKEPPKGFTRSNKF